jgi:hypothetical protein
LSKRRTPLSPRASVAPLRYFQDKAAKLAALGRLQS